ncbi:MAG TPA: cytochrome P450 [Pirellulales bacterium]
MPVRPLSIFKPEPPVLRGVAAYRRYLSFFRDQIGALGKFQRDFGSIVVLRARIPPSMKVRNCIIVSGAELNRQVLSDVETFQSGGLVIRGPRGSALNRLRRGLIGSNGEEHREVRRLVSPLFYPAAIKKYLPNMAALIGQELNNWPQGETVDVAERVSRLSLLVSAQNLLAGEKPEKTLPLAEANVELLRQSLHLGVWLCPLNIFGTPFRRLLKHAEQTERQLLEMIDNHEPQPEGSSQLLDRLIGYHRENPDRLPRENLPGQLFILFSASHETVATAVTWTLFLLSQHPHILTELYEAIENRCGQSQPTFDDLEQLPLLDAIIKETMRLIPPVACVPRRIRAAAEIQGYEVGPKDFVLLNHYATHRDPEVYVDPQQFRPERWFTTQPDSFSYLPFGAGPRTCIGKALGTAAINLLTAMIVQRYRLTLQNGTKIDRSFHVTVAPKYGLPMHVAKQDGQFQYIAAQGNIHDMVDLTRPDATCRPAIAGTVKPAMMTASAAESSRRAA